MSNAGKVALVTGASSGIGSATAVALARDGEFTIALAARRAPRLEEVAARILTAGGTARIFASDLERPGAPETLVREVVASLGRLDLLVNNAGWGYCALLSDIPEEAVRRILELNLVAPFLLTKAALPHLRAAKGVVVNVASAAGLLPSPYYAAYAASKAGLLSMAGALRIEERSRGVRVVSVCPGPVRTEFAQAAGGAPVHADSVGVRVQSADEIARVIVRAALHPRRTIVTGFAVRMGVAIHRFAPPVFDLLVQRWARRLGPVIERARGSGA